jgi:C4-dicarboxylate-specific signal transduction histidine kinase
MEAPQSLLTEDIVRLKALREVLGGFAHEISQPLNAIMIATQVLKLGTQRSGLSHEERGFFLQRLELVASQVRKAGDTIEVLRKFIKGPPSSENVTNLKTTIETILSLMGQQLSGRGIRVILAINEAHYSTSLDVQTTESLLVNSLAFARNAVESVGRKHEGEGLPYDKVLEIRLYLEEERPQVHIEWQDTFRLQDEQENDAVDYGLQEAASVLSSLGGQINTTRCGVVLQFPSHLST